MSGLSENEKRRIVEAYEARLSRHGFDVAALKSGGLQKQYVRHSVHAALFDLTGRRVLDVGCGIAMFYRFLRNAGVPLKEYVGVDIVGPFLSYDRQEYPEARFLELDIFSSPMHELEADVVFMSQLFNARYESQDNEAVAKQAIERCFAASRQGVVIDFMSTYVDYRAPEHHYFDPAEMLRFAKTLTRYVDLRHDYLPFEFTLALRHAPVVGLPDDKEVRADD
ncbi:class I SAM-dependent methyltransferase [Nostoc sp. NIES-2111]